MGLQEVRWADSGELRFDGPSPAQPVVILGDITVVWAFFRLLGRQVSPLLWID